MDYINKINVAGVSYDVRDESAVHGIDGTLTQEGRAADAKAVGNALLKLENKITSGGSASGGGATGGTDIDESRDYTLTTKVEGGKLVAVLDYPAVEGDVVAPSATLDDVAYEGKTYRDIFISANIMEGGDFENGLPVNSFSAAGSPVVTDEASSSPSHSLKCFGTSSQQCQRSSVAFKAGCYHYIAVRGRVDRYVSGGGLGFTIPNVMPNMLITEVTGGEFITKSGITGSPDGPPPGATASVYFGTVSSANVDGYLDDFVIINLTELFTTIPTLEEMDAMYENYIAILNGEGTSGAGAEAKTVEYVIGEDAAVAIDPTAAECVAAFMDEVNKKASEIGMTTSSFTTPSGAGGNNTSPRDLMRMMVDACSYTNLLKIWGKNSRDIAVKGTNPRTVAITTTVQNATLEAAHVILGGKTGSWAGTQNLVVLAEVGGKQVVGVVMGATSANARFTAMKELLDICATVIATPGTDTSAISVTNATSAIAVLVPQNPAAYEGYAFAPLFEQAADTETIPASVTKVITAMTALDFVQNLHDTLTIADTDDDMGGSGIVFEAGDIITYEDALYAMMLPSSNQAAQAVARTIGRNILKG